MMKKLDFNHMILCIPPSRVEQPKIKSIKEVKEFMNILSEKGYVIYPEKTRADFFKYCDNYSSAITRIADDELRPRRVVIKGHNLEIMLYNDCSADHLGYTPPSQPYEAGINGYIKLDGENKYKFSEIACLIKSCWKPRILSEFEI
jgi:hypothetical protein